MQKEKTLTNAPHFFMYLGGGGGGRGKGENGRERLSFFVKGGGKSPFRGAPAEKEWKKKREKHTILSFFPGKGGEGRRGKGKISEKKEGFYLAFNPLP